jgi:hypothetical protein
MDAFGVDGFAVRSGASAGEHPVLGNMNEILRRSPAPPPQVLY